MNLERLPGFNPHDVRGVTLRSADDCQIHVVPSRGLDVLDVRIAGEPAMWVNPSGHLDRPIGALDHIESFFTAGPENVGPPSMDFPLHGTFAWRSATELVIDEQSVTGRIAATDMVRGPYFTIRRRVTALRDVRGFRVEDEITAAVTSPLMWLYHPNFNVADGSRLYADATRITARDRISDRDIERWDRFDRCGVGVANLPPAETAEENFERCYAVDLRPDSEGGVSVALIDSQGEWGATVRYLGDFDAAQSKFYLWKNNRGGVCGLERGNCFMGRQWATDHELLSVIEAGQRRTYRVEVTFPRGRVEIDQAIRSAAGKSSDPILRRSTDGPFNEIFE